ncbi:NlpC/P60 family protein [Pseudonocardia sp. N23]|uniref:NlpC/P60 family protein n=1 Tax=Pseudonocardia sp. N23 TaxID=1987376 RepID=UPI000BFB7040|nr:NlpC/P60 family protein [Pseudonocardia sp. N23]GAY08842.1 putative secreted protein [Pseudonocardia sp. N23]
MATHRAVALLDKPGATRTARPAAELIAEFGVELPSVPSDRPRHGSALPLPRTDVDAAHPLIPTQASRRPDWFTTGWSAPVVETTDDALQADRTTDEVRARVAALLAEFPPTRDTELVGGALFDASDRAPLTVATPTDVTATDVTATGTVPADEIADRTDVEQDPATDADDAPTAADLRAIATDRTGARRVSAAPAGLAGATAAFAVEQARRARLGRVPHQGVVAAASATVLGATAAVVAVTGGFNAHDSAADLSATVDQATQRIELAKPAEVVPPVQLGGNYDSAAKKVAEAADKHRADATQIIAAARAPQHRTGNAGGADAGGGNGGGASVPAVAGSGKGATALRAALTQQGKPYVWGAAGPSAYDCSGLVMWAFKQAGVSLPHSSSAQSTMGTAVSKDQLQPGDLVFFYSPVSHVGIYVGNGNIVHASTAGQPVKISKIANMPFHNARRL